VFIKTRYHNEFFTADEVLKANMNLEKVQQELAAKMEKYDAIQNEVILTINVSYGSVSCNSKVLNPIVRSTRCKRQPNINQLPSLNLNM
jgi:hypothetical protein